MAWDFEKFADLVVGVNRDWLCQYLKIHKKTLERWISGSTDAPEAVRKLLRLKYEGDLASLGGEGWEGFYIGRKDHLLYIPLFRGGFEPGQIKAMFFLCQDAWADKRDLKHVLNQQIELNNELERLRNQNTYYRQQLREAGVLKPMEVL